MGASELAQQKPAASQSLALKVQGVAQRELLALIERSYKDLGFETPADALATVRGRTFLAINRPVIMARVGETLAGEPMYVWELFTPSWCWQALSVPGLWARLQDEARSRMLFADLPDSLQVGEDHPLCLLRFRAFQEDSVSASAWLTEFYSHKLPELVRHIRKRLIEEAGPEGK